MNEGTRRCNRCNTERDGSIGFCECGCPEFELPYDLSYPCSWKTAEKPAAKRTQKTRSIYQTPPFMALPWPIKEFPEETFEETVSLIFISTEIGR